MKALVKSRAEPGIWMEEAPKPTIGPNDLLLRVHYASICGTDLHIVNWDAWAQRTIKVPLVIGHEFEGAIIEIGSEVSGFKVDRIGACHRCPSYHDLGSGQQTERLFPPARPCALERQLPPLLRRQVLAP